ncbi:MAG: DNA-3-methyladenine glycosylase I, partial [Candidatus Cloacimonetes bacterium]|nr:DNA-3-methyladenine glycosylase I [Candidatus Cloacimonadota bacterium]
MVHRCDWVGSDQFMIRYHDREWGVPLHEDNRLYEFLLLDGFQA